MKGFVGYAAVALAVVVVGVGVTWPLLDPRSRTGVALAGAAAFPVQMAAFGLLRWARQRPNRFLAAWGAGILARFGILGIMALVASGVESVGITGLVLGLVGFLFVLTLLEPVFLPSNAVTDGRD